MGLRSEFIQLQTYWSLTLYTCHRGIRYSLKNQEVATFFNCGARSKLKATDLLVNLDKDYAVEEVKLNMLEYQLTEQNSVLMVSFIGSLIKNNLSVLEKIKTEISESRASFVILNFKRVEKIDIPGVSALIQIQHIARTKPKKMRLCFLKSDFVKTLEERGGLRRDELSETLVDAIRSFDFSLKK